MSFKFAKEQRVNVPGSAAQGVILDVIENIPGFPVYTITWLSELGDKLLGSCGEGDLVAANKPQWVPVYDERHNVATLAESVLKLRAVIKRKPARKAKRRR